MLLGKGEDIDMPVIPEADCAGVKCSERKHYNASVAGSVQGKYSQYLDGGYYIDLTRNSSKTQTTLSKLKKTKWIDEDTRLVVICFTVYSDWNTLYTNVKIYFEFPTGPSADRMTNSGLVQNSFYFS